MEHSCSRPGVAPCPRRSQATTVWAFLKCSICACQSSRLHAKPCTNTIGGPPTPARTKFRLLFGVRRPMCGGELLLKLRRRRLVVAELHAVGAVPGGERLQARREMLELRERRLRHDLHGSRPRRIRALDLSAVPRELARDVAHLRLGRDDLDVDD